MTLLTKKITLDGTIFTLCLDGRARYRISRNFLIYNKVEDTEGIAMTTKDLGGVATDKYTVEDIGALIFNESIKHGDEAKWLKEYNDLLLEIMGEKKQPKKKMIPKQTSSKQKGLKTTANKKPETKKSSKKP